MRETRQYAFHYYYKNSSVKKVQAYLEISGTVVHCVAGNTVGATPA